MSDNEQDQEDRTEQASEKRLREAREKGDIPRSRDLSAASVTLTIVATLQLMHESLAAQFNNILRTGLQHTRADLFDAAAATRSLTLAASQALILLAPIFLVAVAAAFLTPLALGGWTFSSDALSFKGERLNPIKGFTRMFSSRGVVELLKALAKILVVGTALSLSLLHLAPKLLHTNTQMPQVGIAYALDLAGWATLVLTGSLVLLSFVDVPWQLFDYARRHRMTHQELRDEYKETEGRPEVKSKIRSMQQQMARRRMMEQVPKADVVVTNPTHYAIALRYEDNKMRAPIVVAKGADLVAAAIRTLAEQHRVPLVAAPPLARALYRSTDLGKEIPAALYIAVAQVLTYVYRLKQSIKTGEQKPELAPLPAIDAALLGAADVT